MTTKSTDPSFLKRRLPFLLMLGLGFVVWKSGFGVLATDRTLEWRIPVSYQDVRQVDLQVWRDDALLKREERSFADGVSSALTNSVPLTRGLHRAVATVRLREGPSKTFTTQFDPTTDSTVVVDFASRPR